LKEKIGCLITSLLIFLGPNPLDLTRLKRLQHLDLDLEKSLEGLKQNNEFIFGLKNRRISIC